VLYEPALDLLDRAPAYAGISKSVMACHMKKISK
jgi:hypothetical protein